MSSADTSLREARRLLDAARFSALLRGGLALVFLAAAAGKALDFRSFLDVVRALEWLPTAAVLPAALLLLALEAAVAPLLLLRRTAPLGARLVCGLALLFLVVNLVSVARGVEADCACFGLLLRLPRWGALAVDLLLFFAGAVLVRLSPARAVARDTPQSGEAAEAEDAEARRADPPGERTSLLAPLCFVFSLCLLGFVQVLPRDPMLEAKLAAPVKLMRAAAAHRAKEARRLELCKRDPAIGEPLPLPGGPSGVRPEAEAAEGLAIVLVTGACTGCGIGVLRDAEDLMRVFPEVRFTVVSSSSAAELAAARTRYHLKLDLAPDPGGNIKGRYNAAWLPRAYMLSGGKLVWIQKGQRPNFREIADAVHKELKR